MAAPLEGVRGYSLCEQGIYHKVLPLMFNCSPPTTKTPPLNAYMLYMPQYNAQFAVCAVISLTT